MLVKEALCREALPGDVDVLYELIQGYAQKGIMLPRSREALLRAIGTFVIAQIGDEIVGCDSSDPAGAGSGGDSIPRH